jgi:acetolactate synthase regulatory subunit
VTAQRQQELERLLRVLRRRTFEYEDAGRTRDCERAEALMLAVKRRLAPIWDARAAEVEHQRGQRLLRLYA